ncbi:MAG: hypothetical protein Q8924_16435 [Bacillota bacterium]|nr:hypothetical protein [Bacillota bacterium]
MAFSDDLTDMLRHVFNEGLDEVLIFAIIFIFILLTGSENNHIENGEFGWIFPLIIIAVFLLVFTGCGRALPGAE